MASIPGKIASRLAAGIKKFQPILVDAKNRDINESDTVTIVVEILSEVFGFDKFREITSERAVKGTYCDLAIKLNDNTNPCLLNEVKAIGIELKDTQALCSKLPKSHSVVTPSPTWRGRGSFMRACWD